MSAKTLPPAKHKNRLGGYLRAIGRAHRVASDELETSQSLLQHLTELRHRIFKAFLAVVVMTGLSFAFAKQLLDYLASPIGGSGSLVSIEITENISVFMKVTLLSGVALAMPVIAYQVIRFVMPGLTPREKGWLLLGVPLATLLFLAGVGFTWFIMLPRAIPFLTGFLDITTQVRPANYFDFILRLMFWMGICFEAPLLFMFLAGLEIINARQLARAWRYAIVLAAALAAVITPTVDPVNMGLVMAPLMGLYLVSVFFAALARRG